MSKKLEPGDEWVWMRRAHVERDADYWRRKADAMSVAFGDAIVETLDDGARVVERAKVLS